MADVRGISSAGGLVPGRYTDERLVCQIAHMTNARGCFWFGANPLNYSVPVVLAQLTLIFFATRTIYWFLKPLGQSIITAQIIAGIILGPTCLARTRHYVEKIFPPGSKLILETMSSVGFMFHLFILGVQADATMLKKAGRSAAVIGTTGFALPHALGGLAFLLVPNLVLVEDTLRRSLPFITVLNSMTTFPVITNLLSELNILNSELGRLAASTSLVTDVWGYIIGMLMTTLGISMRDSQLVSMWAILWVAGFFTILLFVIRPLILWIGNQIPQGQSMKEEHFLAILVITMVAAFWSEYFGQHAALGSFAVGIVVPHGPPLGSHLVHKIDALSTGLLLPIKMVIGGLRVNLSGLTATSAMIIELFIILGYIGKFSGTLVSALYCNIPVCDAVFLSLLMCCKGFMEVAVYYNWSEDGGSPDLL